MNPVNLMLALQEAATWTTSPAMTNVELIRHITPLVGMERENRYLLVITASIGKLNLGSAGNGLKESSAALPRGDTFQNPCMAAVPSGSTRVVSYQDATIKELEEWCKNGTSEQAHDCLWAERWANDHFWVGRLTDNCLWAEQVKCH